MNGEPAPQLPLAHKADAIRSANRFFLGVARSSRSMKQYDPYTLPIFPLTLILQAEGMLAEDMRP